MEGFGASAAPLTVLTTAYCEPALKAGGKTHLIRDSLTASRRATRASACGCSHVVRIGFIDGTRAMFHGDEELILRDGTPVAGPWRSGSSSGLVIFKQE